MGVVLPTKDEPRWLQDEARFKQLFQAAGLLHSSLRTALLIRELLNKRGREVTIRIGSPIAVTRLMEMPTGRDRTEYLRVFVGQLRKKLEAAPSEPRHLATEPWVGYRFNPSA